MTDTKQKILDAAARLIAEQGYAATSLRHIIADAGVNLAAIHYHFGSKEELLDEIIRQNAGPLNEERLARLDQAEREFAPGAPPVERVLEALLMPLAEAADRIPLFVPFMGRMLSEGLTPVIAARHFGEVSMRLTGALRRANPELSEQEFAWRVHFMSGAIAHTMCGAHHFAQLAAAEGDFRSRIGRLVTFLSAGFRARASAAGSIEARSEER